MLDPQIGRWMEEDPSEFEAGDANLYRFVGNDPSNATDPSGLIISLSGPKPYSSTLAGSLDIEVHLPADYDNSVTGTKNSGGVWINVAGKDAQNVSFIQFFHGEVNVDRGTTSAREAATWQARPDHVNGGYEPDGKTLKMLQTGVEYLDAKKNDAKRVGYIESGFPGGQGETSWMYDKPVIASALGRWWSDSPDFKQPAYRAQSDVVSVTGLIYFTTYIVIDKKALYRIKWSVSATVWKSTHPGGFGLGEMPSQEITGGQIESRAEFEHNKDFETDKNLSNGEME